MASFYGGAMHENGDDEDMSDDEQNVPPQSSSSSSSSSSSAAQAPLPPPPPPMLAASLSAASSSSSSSSAPSDVGLAAVPGGIKTWLQCEILECEKWRLIPDWVTPERLADLRKRPFYCYLNPDLGHANCDDVEEKQDELEIAI